MKPQYEPKTLQQKLGYLVEECGEVLAAAGKSIRWGLDSWNPELPPAQRETNQEWLLRELKDLSLAIALVRGAFDPEPNVDGASTLRLRDNLSLQERLRAAESALATARLENSDLSYQLGKAQGEAEGHALARKGLEAELERVNRMRAAEGHVYRRRIAEQRKQLRACDKFQSQLRGMKAQLEAAQASAPDPGELEHLREAAELLRAPGEVSFDHAAIRKRFSGWVARDQSCPSKAAAQPSPAQEPEPASDTALFDGLPNWLDDMRDALGDFHPDSPLHVSAAKLGEFAGATLAFLNGLHEHLKEQKPLTRADVTAIVDARVAKLAKAASDLAGIDHFASRRALDRLQEAAEAGKASAKHLSKQSP